MTDKLKEIFDAEKWFDPSSIPLNAVAHDMSLDRLEAKVREMFGIKHKECAWIKDESHDMYETSCGRAFCFINGGIKDNKMAYCPYCGKEIIEKEQADTEGSDVNCEGDNPIPQEAAEN